MDIIERLPTPFGLVRSGVAPDHPETKARCLPPTMYAANTCMHEELHRCHACFSPCHADHALLRALRRM